MRKRKHKKEEEDGSTFDVIPSLFLLLYKLPQLNLTRFYPKLFSIQNAIYQHKLLQRMLHLGHWGVGSGVGS